MDAGEVPMSASEDVQAITTQELLDRLDPAVHSLLEQAKGLAQSTGWPAIGAGHLALALLEQNEGALDALLQRRFGGLRAATVAGSLRDILELAADSLQPVREGSEDLAPDAVASLARAAQGTAASGFAKVTTQSLTRALCEPPPPFLVEAFQDAGVSAAEIESLVAELPEDRGASTPGPPPPVFQGGVVNLALLGPIARRAVAGMAQRAAERPLTDADLLACFLEEESSRLAEGLHVLGLSPAAIRRHLGRSPAPETTAPAAPAPAEVQLSRLLRRVFQEAAALAAAERCPLISESHLIRAHLDRVGSGHGNLYQRFGIDPLRLRDFLARYGEDREPAAGTPMAEASIDEIEGALRSAVINQDHAIERVLPVLKRIRAGFAEAGRPLAVFLFLGPTGVGKTELARAIATLAFGARPGERDAFLIKLDCGNFTERRDIVQLLGAPQGLVGYKEGQLTNGLREKPRSVILFDEAEKADKEVWQSLLPLFDEGVVREADGTEHDATGCILVATSNQGYKEAAEELGLWERDLEAGELPQEVQDFVWKRLEEYFSPELRGRFGRENMIFFRHFDRASYLAIVRLQIARLIEEMTGRGLAVKVTPEVEKVLVDLAWRERQDGARPVRRLVTKHLRDQIVEAVLADRHRTEFSFAALEGRGEIRLLD
jgi:ATP-dependent Clp protease ATP-binding subunit ClpA